MGELGCIRASPALELVASPMKAVGEADKSLEVCWVWARSRWVALMACQEVVLRSEWEIPKRGTCTEGGGSLNRGGERVSGGCETKAGPGWCFAQGFIVSSIRRGHMQE